MTHTPRRTSSLLASLFVSALMVGCADTEKRTYSVSFKNDSLQPVTVWLTKEGDPYEPSWQPPEAIAFDSRNAGEPVAGMIVPPGKTATIGPKVGTFKPNAFAVLRVYMGQHTISDLLSISKGDPDRKDYDLAQGYNGFNVINQDGQTLIERERPMPMGGSPNMK